MHRPGQLVDGDLTARVAVASAAAQRRRCSRQRRSLRAEVRQRRQPAVGVATVAVDQVAIVAFFTSLGLTIAAL